jgi:hypothetical protein
MELSPEHNTEEHKKVRGVSHHGFRAAAEVAFAHYEAEHGKQTEPLRVAAFYVRGENPVRDYIVQLVPPGS